MQIHADDVYFGELDIDANKNESVKNQCMKLAKRRRYKMMMMSFVIENVALQLVL